MDRFDYLEKLKNCNVWFDYSLNQQNVAERILYDCIMKEDFLLSLKDGDNQDEFVTLWSNAHYHYGIAIENGLKGIIIKYQPDNIHFEVKGDNIILKNIGGHAGKTHNLLKLAEISGVLNIDKGLCTYESDYDALKQVLLHLSDMIKWGARYPIPNNLENIYKFDNAVPPVLVYGFHILDVMQPLFDHFERERIEKT